MMPALPDSTLIRGRRGIPPPGNGSSAVWDRDAYRALALRLGSGRIETCLAMIETRFAALGSLLQPGGDLALRLETEAHSLVSGAGMLGFGDVQAACRLAQFAAAPVSGDPPDRSAVEHAAARLVRAAERAREEIRRCGPGPRDP